MTQTSTVVNPQTTDESLIVEQKTPRKRINQETFFRVWEEIHAKDGTIADVAAALGVSKANVHSRSSQLIKAGVPLKKLRSKNRKITLQDSLAMLAKVRGVSIEEVAKESSTMVANNSTVTN